MINFSLKKAMKYMAKNENDKAEKNFLKAIKKNDINAFVSYGYFLTRKGEGERAVLLFEEKIIPFYNAKEKKNQGEEILIYTNYAVALANGNNLKKAISVTEELLGKYETTMIYGNLGYYYLLSGETEKAKECSKKGYEFSPEDITIIDNLARIYFLEGEYEKAGEYYSKLMSKNPGYPDAYSMYAEFLIETGNKNQAISALEKCLSFNFTALTLSKREEVEKLCENLKKEN